MAKKRTILTAPVQSPAPNVADWMARLRAALFDAVTETDVAEIAGSLVKKAKEGDLQATRLLFSYVLGSSSVNVKQAVIVQGEPSRLPLGVANALPGTEPKIIAMQDRAANGESLFHPRDKQADLS